MIRFFRQLRQNLLMENKTSRYLKYAIGEIILVVIGILIALSINNWNNDRLIKKEVVNYLTQIKGELKIDIEHYKEDLTGIQKSINFLDHISAGHYSEVDVADILNHLAKNYNTRVFGVSYNKLLESGNIDFIEDISLKTQLQSYFFEDCTSYNDVAGYHAKFVSDNIEGPLLHILRHEKKFQVHPEDVINAMESTSLRSFVNWQISFLDYYLPKIENNIQHAEELILLLNKL
jgi:Family of unknown function (DUF6090)